MNFLFFQSDIMATSQAEQIRLLWSVGVKSPENCSWCPQSLSRVRLLAAPRTVAHQALLSLVILQARILEWVAMPSSRGSFNPGIKPRSPTLQVNSSLPEPPGKPKNTGVGSLSLPQGIFQTQEWNWGLLHCRWILHQLTYQGSPELGDDMFFLI